MAQASMRDKPLHPTIPPQGRRSIIERLGTCGGLAGERQIVDRRNTMGRGSRPFISQTYEIPFVDVGNFDIAPAVVAIFSSQVVRRNRAIPVNEIDGTVVVAMVDPSDLAALNRLRQATPRDLQIVATSEEALSKALDRYYGAN